MVVIIKEWKTRSFRGCSIPGGTSVLKKSYNTTPQNSAGIKTGEIKNIPIIAKVVETDAISLKTGVSAIKLG